MTGIAAQAVRMQAGALAQSIDTAVARQQIDAERAVAAVVAETADAARPVPPLGQGQRVDRTV